MQGTLFLAILAVGSSCAQQLEVPLGDSEEVPDTLQWWIAALASLLCRSRDGIQMVEHIEAADGGTVFAHACRLGLESIASKRRDRPYEHGRSRAWLKIRNPVSAAAKRIEEGTF